MPSQRQFFSDAVSTKLLFYSPAGDSGAAAADPVGAVEAADGYGAPSVTPTPTSAAAAAAADSVARYLEEFYPTKPEFKARTKAYVAALRGRDATAAAAAGDFAGMQELTRRVLKDFSNWRFYKALATDSDLASDGGRGGGGNRSGVGGDTGGGGGGDRDVEGMIVMRQDEEDGVTATFYFWAAGLVKARDPRDRQFSAGEVEILRQVGEGHPSEVYEARIKATGETVAAKKLKDWKKTAGGSLVRERDWLLLFDDPNILPYKGTVVLAMTMSDCTAVNARKGGGGGGGGGGRYSISRGGVSADSTIAYVLTEFMPRGRLSDLCRTGPVDPRLCVQYAMDLANGLRALHERSPPVMHRDLHSDNILIGEDRAVLADLGSAKEVIHGERHTESLIHYKYIKPLEVQDKSSDPSCLGALYGTPFDIYALACMVIGMALGIPCIEIRDHELRSKDLQDAGLKIPTLLPLLRSMLAEKADQRPTAKDVAAKLKEVLAKL